MVHHRTCRRNSSHNQSREFSFCVPRNGIVCHYLVIGSLHKLSVRALIRFLALSSGCCLLGSQCPINKIFTSCQRHVILIISVDIFFSPWRIRAPEQLFFLLIGKNISTKGSSLSVRDSKIIKISRHHAKIAFLLAILRITLRQSCMCQLQGYNISTSLKVSLYAQPVCIMALYHLGNITAHVHTNAFHRYLEHLGRNALQATHIIQASSNYTANATHSGPACALRKTAHSHKLHGIANRSVVASRIVLYSRIRRTVKHTSNALAHHSRTYHACDSSSKSGIGYSRHLCHAIAEYLSCNSSTCFTHQPNRR